MGVFSCVSYLFLSAVLFIFIFFFLQKCFAAKKLKQSMGNKSMSFPTEKSDRYVVEAMAPETQLLLGGLDWKDRASQDQTPL